MNVPVSTAGEAAPLPPDVTMAALDRPRLSSRRRALQQLALLLSVGGAGALGMRELPWRVWAADERTQVGERRELALPDGSSLWLNTASAVDLRFDADQRSVLLREGEILIRTAADPVSPSRPFIVETAQGSVRALGTRFTVRQDDSETRVTVHEHAVEVRVTGHAPRHLDAGQALRFGAASPGELQPADANTQAWTRGLLHADHTSLGELVAELSRHRPGVLRCDPAVADLRVSGAFPLAQTDEALAMLERTLPVRVRRGFGRWVTTLEVRTAE